MAASDIICHICGKAAISLISDYERLHRVTSDSRPWPAGGKLGVCPHCGCAQKAIDDEWRAEAARIYRHYELYRLANGYEPAVFKSNLGQRQGRSARLLERVFEFIEIPPEGRLLDIGYGSGALLRAFSSLAPGWTLTGTELNDHYREIVQDIKGVESLYRCEPEKVDGQFNLITMTHVIEHILSPGDFLSKLHGKLAENGMLVIETADCLQNPIDLLIADHCTHFTLDTLSELLERHGYSIEAKAGDWIPKEITVVARKREDWESESNYEETEDITESLADRVQWLNAAAESARSRARGPAFGLFGSSNGAAWLFSELGGAVDFFVDEDPHRIGKTFQERPIYMPNEVPEGSEVFIAIPGAFAEAIFQRVNRSEVKYYLPPELKSARPRKPLRPEGNSISEDLQAQMKIAE